MGREGDIRQLLVSNNLTTATLVVGSTVVLGFGRQTCDQEIAGTTAGWGANDSGQVVYMLVPLSASSVILYRSVCSDALQLGR